MHERKSLRLLFVCSMNQWRSPTAEKVYSNHPGVQVRSCGTSLKARRTASLRDVQWADIVFAMETKHRQRLLTHFSEAMLSKEVHVLHIPDEYKLMDPELIEELRLSIDPYLQSHFGADSLT